MSTRRGKGEGSIRRRQDGRWEANVTTGWKDGKRQRKYVYGRTRAEVAAKLGEVKRALESGTLPTDDRLTVAEFLDSWLVAAKPTIRPSTWGRYEQYVRLHAKPGIGRVKVSKLTPQHLQRLYGDRLAAGVAPQTVVHLHRTLHRAFGQGVRWGTIGRNVAALVDPPRVQRPEVVALTPDEARRLLRAAEGDRLEALYVLALTTGLRRGELLALRWSDVDLEAGRLRVRRAMQRAADGGFVPGDPKTKRSRRPVLLTPLAIGALRRHRERQAEERELAANLWLPGDLVFTNRRGGPIAMSQLLRQHLYPLLDRAGVRRVRFHDLRHSTATLLLAAGIHPKIVSEMLGHSAIAITLDLYSHATETMQREASDALEKLLGGQIGGQPARDEEGAA